MKVDEVLAFKLAMERAVAEVLEQTGTDPHEVQVRVTWVLDNGTLCFYDVVVA